LDDQHAAHVGVLEYHGDAVRRLLGDLQVPSLGPLKHLPERVDYAHAGYRVSEHPRFGGVNPMVHSPRSYHKMGRAIDVNWSPPKDEPAMLDRLYDWIKANVRTYRELLWQTKGHYDHLHLAI
jgi:hypothetical protein